MKKFQPTCQLLLVTVFALLVSACSSKPELGDDAIPPTVALPKDTNEENLNNDILDPFEGFNRRMYYFNAKADEHVILPVVKGYQAVTPDFVEKGVSNFFNNLGEVPTFINSVLQLKIGIAAETFGRFAVNTTIGLAGLFDVATPIGLEEQQEDFGQTLGYWGVSSGPYLVLPLMGPSSLRDAVGASIDMVAFSAAVDELGMKSEEEAFLSLLRGIDTRASIPFRYYASGSAFEYEKLRLLYLKYRELQVAR
ncbi:MlaA family lipoprotein [Thalassotalea atypica]|uniref:MlaA family lipoprotein n=1 Tax=Thalassotalea atypica TaxID=2054316 RepID=UPI0025730BFD|nr:VacJ family lipoprotein [Thalassotalea atypica]